MSSNPFHVSIISAKYISITPPPCTAPFPDYLISNLLQVSLIKITNPQIEKFCLLRTFIYFCAKLRIFP